MWAGRGSHAGNPAPPANRDGIMSSPAARVAGTDFRPPRRHSPTLRLFQTLLPVLLRRVCGVVAVDIPAGDIGRLRALAGERLLLAPEPPDQRRPRAAVRPGAGGGNALPLPVLPGGVRPPARPVGAAHPAARRVLGRARDDRPGLISDDAGAAGRPRRAES